MKGSKPPDVWIVELSSNPKFDWTYLKTASWVNFLRTTYVSEYKKDKNDEKKGNHKRKKTNMKSKHHNPI